MGGCRPIGRVLELKIYTLKVFSVVHRKKAYNLTLKDVEKKGLSMLFLVATKNI
jgi:hypothetical protein